MRRSRYVLPTLKETPAEAEVVSHRLMLRAGMIRQSATGIYSWLPLGLRVLHKITDIVRAEMESAGAIELLMPMVQPADIWHESGRIRDYGAELLRFLDRHDREFCLGPTHEEVVTDIARAYLSSYKQLPRTVYQIQTKFRDEVRPRFGIMRSREFVMKDAYSFHADADSLDATYAVMYAAYCRIFDRIGVSYRAVTADTGSIGGNASHEFHVLADSGEDAIAVAGDYAANVETVPCLSPDNILPSSTLRSLRKVATPNKRTVREAADACGVAESKMLKALVVDGIEAPIMLIVRGDHSLNTIKAEKIPGVRTPLRMTDANTLAQSVACTFGSLGPIGTPLRVIVDYAAAACTDFACGANEDGYHYVDADWARDVGDITTADIRNVAEGDIAENGVPYRVVRGIEVGHIFKLGDKYSRALQGQFSNENGEKQPYIMGCYGIGVSRIAAAVIEQYNDERGIAWPDAIAPFTVSLIVLGNDSAVLTAADALYDALCAAGIEVLYDDRDTRAGAKFAESDLIGIPHRLVIGRNLLAKGMVEYKGRTDDAVTLFPHDAVVMMLCERLKASKRMHEKH